MRVARRLCDLSARGNFWFSVARYGEARLVVALTCARARASTLARHSHEEDAATSETSVANLRMRRGAQKTAALPDVA